MVETKWKYGIRPAVEFHHARGNRRNGTALLGKVCIIGAFPTISDSFLRFTSWSEAAEALNINSGKNDVYYEIDSSGNEVEVDHEKVYDGAVALRWAFMKDYNDVQGASEVLICNITTQQLRYADSNGNTVSKNAEDKVIDKDCKDDVPIYNTRLTHDPIAFDEGLVSDSDKLKIALSKLKKEKFDSIIFAYDLNNELAYYNDSELEYVTITDDGKMVDITSEAEKKNGIPKPIASRLIQLRDFTHDSYNATNPIGLYIGLTVPPTEEELTETNVDGTPIEQTAIKDGFSVVDSIVETNKSKDISRKRAEMYASIFDDPIHHAHSLYCLVCDGIKMEGKQHDLKPMEVASYICAVESGLPVDTIMGQRALPHMIGVPEELNYDPRYLSERSEQNDGIHLLAHGITVFECINRANNEWAIVNSRLPCGYDISHLRTTAYVIKQIALSPFLCKINNDVTRESVDSVIASLKDRYVERFANIISIDHHLAEKRSPSCIEIYLYFNLWGIIINECVYVAMGVEEDAY